MRQVANCALALCLGLALSMGGCGDDDDDGDGGSGGTGSPDNTGKVCTAPDECYPDVADGQLKGQAMCLDRVTGGYCTHLCTADTDCCAVEGECKTTLKQVCSPFESTGQMMCFLSCEDADRGGLEEQEYCQKNASREFICRSSGGGSGNRKVCVPGDCGVGERCGADTDCDPDLVCLTEFNDGYCGRKDCTVNADCPTGSLCAAHAGGNYCLRSCTALSDCTFCRDPNISGTCRNDVALVDPLTPTGSVCVPPG